MEREDQIRILFNSYLQGNISREDLENFIASFSNEADKALLSELLLKELSRETEPSAQKDIIHSIAEAVGPKIFAITNPHKRLNYRRPWLAIAASLLIGIAITSYFLLPRSAVQKTGSFGAKDFPAGKNNAVLTLGNGSRIDLNSANNGKLASQPNTTIDKAAGEIVYSQSSGETTVSFNTLETPKGGQYQLTLPDGTRVWLNAASKLKYPTTFNSAARIVELSGEGYFDVAKNASKPFRVISGEQTIEVLGTHFNIMAYEDENFKRTTLLEGSIRASTPGHTQVVKPGEDAIIKRNKGIDIRPSDLDAAIAWKNGKTYFKNADIPTMMRSLGRWYNIDIEYRGQIPQRHFTGGISRRSSLSGMLKIFELNDIHTKIEGKKLIVTP